MVILCDLDAIVVDLLAYWLGAYNIIWNDNKTVADVKSWEMHENVKPECGHKIYGLLNLPKAYKDLRPLPGSLETLQKIHNDGHEIIIVSASANNPKTAADKISWVRKHLPFLSRKNIFIGHKKWLLKGDVFIDDSPENISNYRAHWPKATIMTIAYPYNEIIKDKVDVFAADHSDTENAWSIMYKAINQLQPHTQKSAPAY